MNSLTVFFDAGFTLIDSPDLAETITRRLVEKWPDDNAYDLVSEVLSQISQYKDERCPFKSIDDIYTTILALLAREYGYKDISNQAHDIYLDMALHKTSLFPETISVLEKLLKNGVKMVIAADEDTEIMDKKLVKYDLNKYFVDKCISGSVRAYKPANRFISYLKKYTANNEDNCYFVGDTEFDVACGKRLGIKSVLIDRKGSIIKVYADYIIHNLNELLPILNLK